MSRDPVSGHDRYGDVRGPGPWPCPGPGAPGDRRHRIGANL